MNCKICHKEFGFSGSLHSHLTKAHKITQAEYYRSFFPRYDKWDETPIKFKDFLSYFETDFNSRDSLLNWCQKNREEAKPYCLNLIRNRMEKKSLSSFPAQVELKSLMCPSLIGFESLFGSIDATLQAGGFESRFDYTSPIEFSQGEMQIFMDSREQLPMLIDNLKKEKLIVGDYMPDSNFYCNLFIERKSLSDLAGTLTAGLDRFKREIDRAAELGMYLVVLVECSYNEALAYRPATSFSKKLTGAHIFHEIRSLMCRDNIQFVFSGNRRRGAEMAEKIFRMKDRAKTADLEFLKDKGML